MKVYLVVFKDYAHGPKILEDSKVFLNKNQAQEFCDSLNAEPSDWWEDNEHYFVDMPVYKVQTNTKQVSKEIGDYHMI